MPKCGLVENYKGKLLPPCTVELDSQERCAKHCRANLRGERKGKLCTNRHRKGKRGCRMHGGNAKVGLASPNLKTGQYSRYLGALNKERRERFEQVRSNPDYLSLAPDIYMVQLRIDELVGKATSGESGQ